MACFDFSRHIAMQNPFGPDRYYAYSHYLRQIFGHRVQKLTIDAGFTCPNRDGSKGVGGCTYCNNDAFNPSYCAPSKSIEQQMAEGMDFHRARYRRAKGYLAYFQAFSNTYAPLGYLKDLYTRALAQPGVVGLVIGTRPDCVDAQKLDFLSELAQKWFIAVEFGIESCYDDTLVLINRGHSVGESRDAVIAAAKRGLPVTGHIIFGLPGESETMMLDEARLLSAWPLTALKFHQLQIIHHTPMARQYEASPKSFSLFDLEGYIDFVIRFVERLRPDIAIERFSSEAPPRFQAGPNFGLLRTDQVLGRIVDEMQKRDTWQGRLFGSKK